MTDLSAAPEAAVNYSQFAELAGIAKWPEKLAEPADAARLFHGRGQCYPGFEWLTVDYFAPVLWIVVYREPPGALWQDLCQGLLIEFGGLAGAAVVQHRYRRPQHCDMLWGELPDEVYAQENGLRFELSLGGQQNIGYFMDMQPARAWLADRVAGKRVLNLFSYTCAFSVAAHAAGAEAVVNIDMSKAALRRGKSNHQINGLDGGDTLYLGHDIFRSWGRLRREGPFDIVICDPPSRQPGSFDAAKDYARLARKLAALCREGGDILACLNSPLMPEQFLRDVLEAECPEARFVERLPGREDFPDKSADGALKVLHYRC